MNILKLAYRNLFRKKQNTVIKILSLGTGLSVGLVLLSKVSFEQHYDDYFPDAQRIYRVETRVVRNDEPKEFGQVSGAIAPGFKEEVPGVETATRFTGLSEDNAAFYTEDRKRFRGTFILADNHFFEVLPRPMLSGDATEILSQSMQAMVSQSLAKRMGGNVAGKSIRLEAYPDKEIIIGGVFLDVPENSTYRYDVIVSMESLPRFFWDGRENWMGNDRYISFVKLQHGVDPKGLAPAIRKMQEKNQPLEEIAKSGIDLSYALVPLVSLHCGSEGVKNAMLVLAIIAFALLLTAVLNYLLIVITNLMQRSKEMAVNKCYGASQWNILRLISSETLLIFFLALLFALLLLYSLRPSVEQILGASFQSLFSANALAVAGMATLLIFAIAVLIPAGVVRRIPLATVFRQNKRMKQSWKLLLLFIQFAAAAMLLSLTASVGKQYRHMINDDPGYDYRNLVYFELPGVDSTTKILLRERLTALPEVEPASLCSMLPLNYMSGNNVSIPGSDKELFNIADLYFADERFLPLMDIPLNAGKNFERKSSYGEAVVSESFREKMKTLEGWDDIVGREVMISEHGLTRIVGVFPDIRIGSMGHPDTRPTVLFYSANSPFIIQHYTDYLLVKVKNDRPEAITAVSETAAQLLPGREVIPLSYGDNIVKSYDSERLFRNAILIGSLVTLIIAIIGLIGYINNEIAYRTSEIAIRKINGATLDDILRIFARKIFFIAIPAVMAGLAATALLSHRWLGNFSEQWPISLWQYLLLGLALLLLIETVVLVNCFKAANQNPVDSLKKK